MENTQRQALFESVPVPRAVATLAIPTILSSLVMVLYNLADTYFVGMLNNSIQTSAVTLAAPVLLAFNAVNNLFGVGSSSMMSRALGRKDLDTLRRSSAFGFYCALFFGLCFSVLYTVFQGPFLTLLGATDQTSAATQGYLFWTTTCGAAPAILNVVMAYLVRAEGSALHASIGTMSGCLLNILLDPVFILPWGFDMGAAGAGLATFLSNCVACLYFFVLLFVRRGKTYVCIRPSAFRPSREIVVGVCGVGIPASIQNLLNVTGMTVLNNFTAAYGPAAVAAMGIVQKVNMVPMYVSMGLSQGIMPLISYSYAARGYGRMRSVIRFSSVISVSFMVLISVFYHFAAGNLVALFIEDAEIIGYGTRLLSAMSLSLPFLCFDFLVVGVYQACGTGRVALVFAILRKIVLEIPALYLLNRLLPLYGLGYAQPVAEVILACTAFVVLTRLMRSLDG